MIGSTINVHKHLISGQTLVYQMLASEQAKHLQFLMHSVGKFNFLASKPLTPSSLSPHPSCLSKPHPKHIIPPPGCITHDLLVLLVEDVLATCI